MAGSAEAAGAELWPELVADSQPKTAGEGVDSPLEQTTRRPFKQDRVKGSAQTSMVDASFPADASPRRWFLQWNAQQTRP